MKTETKFRIKAAALFGGIFVGTLLLMQLACALLRWCASMGMTL